MMKHLAFLAAALLFMAGARLEAQAQSEPEELRAAVLSMDGRFWQAYNACQTASFAQFFADDVEFYHDKGGRTIGAAALTESLRTGLCGGDTRLRREAVEGTVRVYPMREENVAYGAIVEGEHRFYVREGSGPERLDGLAQFINLWLLEDGAWKMSRVLSYDHGPAPYVNTRERITLADSQLEALAGSYQGSGAGTMRIERRDGGLVLSAANGGMPPMTMYPESAQVFFLMERDLTFEFVREGETMKMRVRERGTVVEEAVRRD